MQAKGKTSEAITKLVQLAPPTALLLELDPKASWDLRCLETQLEKRWLELGPAGDSLPLSCSNWTLSGACLQLGLAFIAGWLVGWLRVLGRLRLFYT